MKTILFSIYVVFMAMCAHTQTLLPNSLVTNGDVHAIIRTGNTVYVGGEFSYVGPNTPYGTALDIVTGAVVSNITSPNGLVRCAEPDGSGGWYIGGDFTNIGGVPRNHVARINADGSLNSWHVEASDKVLALALYGATLYLGGDFTMINGISREKIAAVDLPSNILTSWNPGANSSVNGITILAGNIYVRGDFVEIGGQLRSRIASFSLTTGGVTLWNPNPDYFVTAIKQNGNKIYVAGGFTSIGGQARNRLAAFDILTGALASWSPSANSTVCDLEVSGATVFVSGVFTIINGQARYRVAALDTSSGGVTSWNPVFLSTVVSIEKLGDTLYAGTSEGISKVAVGSTLVLSSALCSGNMSFFETDGASFFAGGGFESIGGAERHGLAAFDMLTGKTTLWNPGISAIDGGVVLAMTTKGNRIFVAGQFDYVNGQLRHNIAAVDSITGMLTSWDPNVTGAVHALSAHGDTLYIGGSFYQVGGQVRNCIAAIKFSTGAVIPWAPHANGAVFTFGSRDSIIVIGGDFSILGGQPRSYLAAINANTGVLTPWDPNSYLSIVRCVTLDDSMVYAGGYGVEAIDRTSGSSSWYVSAGDYVESIAISKGRIYAGGGFNGIGGTGNYPQNGLASLEISTGAITSWDTYTDAGLYSPISLFFILYVSGDTLYTGGHFTSLFGNSHPHFAAFNTVIVPKVSIISSVDTVCNGTLILFTASALDAGVSPEYQWRKNSVLISGATDSVYAVSTLAMGDIIDCMLTSSYPGALTDTSIGIGVVVNACPPVITAISDSSLCKSKTVDINFNLGGGYNSGNVFKAQLSNEFGSFATPVVIGTDSFGTGHITAVIPSSQETGTQYRVRIVTTNPVLTGPNNGFDLSISSLPTGAQVTVSPATPPATCQNTGVLLSVPSNAGFAYQWTKSGNFIAGATNASHLATITGSYAVRVINLAGCLRGSTNKTVTIISSPVATITPSVSQGLCFNQSVNFQANAGSGLSYKWYRNGLLIAGATNSSYSAGNTGKYSAEVVNASGCRDTSDLVNISSSCGPVILDTGSIHVCPGATLPLAFNSLDMDAGNYFTLQLSDNSGSFANPQTIGIVSGTSGGLIAGTIPISTPSGSGYKVRVKSSSPGLTGTTASLMLNVLIKIPDTLNLCAVTIDDGRNLLVWNKPVGSSIDSFVFYRNTALTGEYDRIGAQPYTAFSTFKDMSSEPEVKAYRYFLTGKNVCGETAPGVVHRTMHLTISKGQETDSWNLIWNGYEGALHSGYEIWRGTTPITMTFLAAIEANNYNSYTDFTAGSGAVYYMVKVADGPSCSPTAKSTGAFDISSNIATNQTQYPGVSWIDFQVFPNPSSFSANALVRSSESDTDFDIRVIDLTGRTVEVHRSRTDQLITFGVTLVKGVYLVEASGNGQRITKRWLKL
jgi:hypothetical protein